MYFVTTKTCVFALLFAVTISCYADSQKADVSRRFSFEYKTSIDDIDTGSGPVHVFIPLAVSSNQQRVVSETIEASIPGVIEVEPIYGNRYWHGTADQAATAIEVTITSTVERLGSRVTSAPGAAAIDLSEQEAMKPFLAANDKVLVGHPILLPILTEIKQAAADGTSPISPPMMARAIYDWVVNNVEYKKVGSGWGNGDTFWACNERYGNCTDFHALFISLARSENIPARFEIGFPIPDDRESGVIGGYHCWVQFHLNDTGWFPIDASEAFKHPEKKEFFYGTHPLDRIHFSTGRDLRLGADHKDKPLNYFVYPYVEVDGRAYTGPISKHFAYQNLSAN